MNIFFDLDNLVVAKDEVKKEDIELVQTPELLQIRINSMVELDALEKKLNKLPNLYMIVKSLLIKTGKFICPQKIDICRKNKTLYCITRNTRNVNILEKGFTGYNLLKIDTTTDTYKFKNNNSSKKERNLEEIKKLLDTVSSIEELNNEFSYAQVYGFFNLVTKDYNPIISDDILSLSARNDDINECSSVSFDIVLNKTKEVVGRIAYSNTDKFSYEGNTNYRIEYKYQNNGYATRALTLLKQFLANHSKQQLYIAIKPDNIYSIKVAENNGAELIYDGQVPKDEVIYFVDGAKEIKVYKLDIK